jgi:C-terminal processing protease CtpA/Prc
VNKVERESPAEKAGVKSGDVVVAVNNASIGGASDLRNNIGVLPIGECVTLTSLRDGKKQDVNVAIAPVPEAQTAAANNPVLEGARFAETKAGEGGVVVVTFKRARPPGMSDCVRRITWWR